MEYLIYIAPFVIGVAWYLVRQERQQRNAQAGPAKPRVVERIARHPVVNPGKCIGCGSCITACPEQKYTPVLGLVYAKAQLLNPEACMGHGLCEAACPAEAITLVASA